MINNLQETSYCWVWDDPCPHVLKCAQKNKKRLHTILELKKEYWNKQLSIIAIELIKAIENIYDINWVNSEFKVYVKHFLANWLWALVDTLFIDCNHSVTKDSRLLHNYLLNLQRLKSILDISKALDDRQRMSFLLDLKKKWDSFHYKANLWMLHKILMTIKKSAHE